MSYSKNPECFGRLTYFVSHAWTNNFGKLVDIVMDVAAKDTKEGKPEPFFWIDCIAINQHKLEGELDHLGNVLRDALGTLAICDPWDKPVAVSRSWCLYEFLTTIQSKREFIVALSREQQESFVAALVEHFDSVDRWISRVDARQASASLASDKEKIDSAVASTIGFERLNETVQVALKRWLRDAGEDVLSRLAESHGARHERVLRLQNSLGMMLRQQQADRTTMERALYHCSAVLEARREQLGPEHPDTLQALAAVGMIHRALGDKTAALAELRAASDGLAAVYGSGHPAALRAANDLGFTLKAQGKLDAAEALLRESLANLDEAVQQLPPEGQPPDGEDQTAPQPPVTLVPEAEADGYPTQQRQRRLDELEDVRCSLLSNLGGVLALQGRHAEAQQLLETSWGVKRKLKGAKHPSSLMTAADVAMARHAKALAAVPQAGGPDCGEDDRPGESAAEAEEAAAMAVEMLRDVLTACTEVLGGEHRHTAMLLNNLAVMLVEQGWWRTRLGAGTDGAPAGAYDLAPATELFSRSIRAYIRSRGPGHPCTIAVLLNCGLAEAAENRSLPKAEATASGSAREAKAAGHADGADPLSEVDPSVPKPLRRLAAHALQYDEAREALQASQPELLRVLLAGKGASGAAHKSFHARAIGGAGSLALAPGLANDTGADAEGGEGSEEAEAERVGDDVGGEWVRALREWLNVSMAANLVLLREPSAL